MKNKLVFYLFLSGFSLLAQEQQLSLENLNDFKDQAGNWKIVGNVVMDRNIDVHKLSSSDIEVKSKKKKRKKKTNTDVVKPMVFTDGTGILINLDNATQKDKLVSKWEHGDIKLELEVMIPKGSNSGIYLQGRYELQLKDSWGVQHPSFSDLGGIYRNWETEPDKIFRGIPPSSNAAKAPGLWQKLKIHFQAPKFNEAGEKIANAKFISVALNGIIIHDNVEVPLPTGGPISKEETAKGPLMIQGDHGPIAFRNIRYQLLKESSVELSSLTYKTYKGEFKGLDELENQPIVSEGIGKLIDISLINEEDNYGIVYNGTLDIPTKDDYIFSVGYTGGIDLVIDGENILNHNSADAQGNLDKTIPLTAGKHSFTLTNIKSAGWRAPRLGLYIATTTTNPKGFHAYDSYPSSPSSVSSIFVNAESKPRLLRGFVSFKGNGERLSHTIGVGMPSGINFVYNLGSGNIIGAWRGDFSDATPMWHDRGDGSFRPKGAVQWTFLNQPIAKLTNAKSPFPKTGEASVFVSKGYAIDQTTGLPIFKHIYKDVEIENRVSPNNNQTHLIHEVRFSKTGLTSWYCKLAQGKAAQMPDGSFAINDQQYYVKILSGQEPIIREVNGETELIIAVDGSTIEYEIIW